MRVGIQAGLSVDHLVVARRGARYDELGGPGLYAALGARLVADITPVVLSDLPDDDQRFDLLFERLAIETIHARRVESVPALWILNDTRGRRVVAVRPSAIELDVGPGLHEIETQTSDVDWDKVNLNGLLISNPESAVSAEFTGVLGVDPDQSHLQARGWEYLREVAPPKSVLLPSRVQLGLLSSDPREAALELSRQLQCSVIARLDVDGMYVVQDGRAWTLTDERVLVEETTGAGDASAAAIVAALISGHSIATAAAIGMSVARLALSAWGAGGLIAAHPIDQPFTGILTSEVNL